MPNAVWTGTLSFGLVSVPVRLFPATEPKDVRFHQFDRSGRRVRYRRVVDDDAPPLLDEPPGDGTSAASEHLDEVAAPEPDEPVGAPEGGRSSDASDAVPTAAPARPGGPREVEWEDIVLGSETATGETVFVEREEIERLRPRRSATIDIEGFVELEDIDPVYFEKTYHAVPRTADDAQPYVLLLRAMQRAGRVGIGRFVLRTKPHLVAIRPMADVLAIETLFFGDEVRDPSRVSPVPLASVEVSERELTLAEQLIGMLETDWDPTVYADTYREELLELLAAKDPVVTWPRDAPGGAPAGGRIDALMSALRDSVEAAKRERASHGSGDRSRSRAG